jgi:hypothetical protein
LSQRKAPPPPPWPYMERMLALSLAFLTAAVAASAWHRRKVPTPWFSRFSGYRSFGGYRLPARGGVRWRLDSGPFLYFRGEITGCSAE